MNQTNIADVLTDLNRELQNNPLLEFIAMMTIVNNKIKRERRKAKESSALTTAHIDKLMSLYDNIKNYLKDNDSVVKLVPANRMETIYKHCGMSKIDDLDDKISKLEVNRDKLTVSELDSVYECMEKVFESLQEAVKQTAEKTKTTSVLPPVPIIAPAPAPASASSVPAPASTASVPIYNGPVEDCNITECIPASGADKLLAQIMAAKDYGFFLYFEDYNNYKFIGGSDEGVPSHAYPDNELILMLNNNIELLGNEKISVLYKIVKDVTYYLYEHQHFMAKGGARGAFWGWDFTIENLEKYIKNPKDEPSSWPKKKRPSSSSKIMALYLRSLTKIFNIINVNLHGYNLVRNTNFLDQINKYEKNENLVVDEVGIPYNVIAKKESGQLLMLEKSGGEIKLVGGNLQNDKYYEKYMKYKAKYMKLKSL